MAASGNLFGDLPPEFEREELGESAALLRGFVSNDAPRLVALIGSIAAVSPFRHLMTPGGKRMSVAMTNCGSLGWTSDAKGYRYVAADPETESPWPQMPELFMQVARKAAAELGFPSFEPEACLINRYEPGSKLTLHQDKDEHEKVAPIVSVSLGLPAVFQFGGLRRQDPVRRFLLENGDVVVWGGPNRFNYHGVQPLKPGTHNLTGDVRLNLTFRRVRAAD